jgi:hypothetical protein
LWFIHLSGIESVAILAQVFLSRCVISLLPQLTGQMGKKRSGGRASSRGGKAACSVPAEDRIVEAAPLDVPSQKCKHAFAASASASAPKQVEEVAAVATGIDKIPGVRLREKSALTGAEPKKRKTCNFLCGATCHESPDPLDPERPSIRWAYDVADATVPSTGEGGNDWVCERVWSEEAHKHHGRNRTSFQSLISKDKNVHSDFLAQRTKFIEKRKKRVASSGTKRSGFHSCTQQGTWHFLARVPFVSAQGQYGCSALVEASAWDG